MPKSAKHQKRTAPAASALRRSRLINWIAGVVVLGMVATVAVISAGFDAAEAPRQEASVWAIKGGGSGTGQYGRVNTLTGEIDAVRQVENSTGLLQQGSNTVVLARGKGWGIDPTGPHDLVDEKSAGAGKASGAQQGSPSADPGSGGAESPSVDLPPGVVGDPISAGDAVLFRTEEGRAYLSRLTDAASGGAASASTLSSGQELDPLAEERAQADPKAAEKLQFFVDAAAMDENGEVALYSADAHEVRWYSGTRGAFTRTDEVPEIDLGEDARKALQLAIVAGSWVLFDSTTGRLWREGSADRPIATGVDQGGRLQASSTAAAGDEVLVAGPGGLWRSSTKRIEAQQQSAIPAQPMAVGATRFAGWVASAGEVSAVLWTLSEPGAKPETKQLEADATAKPEQGDRKAVFRSSGTSSLLTEQASGTMWLVPDGRLISAAQWGMDETAEQPQKTETKEPKDQLPPVAVDDEFGVRAGEPT
ncbi:MAG: hypothetical protein J0H64_05895, partial [Actinobacteria bacterium]|nr:hypothetical protein [Actinomycetota bacterium]